MKPGNIPSAPGKALRRCLCGETRHSYESCYHLNPYRRKERYYIRPSMIQRINKQLHVNDKMRKYVLRLGYEYYKPLEPFEGLAFVEPVDPQHKLENLPTELIELIIEWTNAITLEELPESHPTITNELVRPRSSHRGCSSTIPSAMNPPTRDKSGSWRRWWLRQNPGRNWGPKFHVIYVSKMFYEIGKRIKYKEFHVDLPISSNFVMDAQFHHQSLLSSRIQALTPATKAIHLTIDEQYSNIFQNIAVDLEKVPQLKHLAITLEKDTWASWNAWRAVNFNPLPTAAPDSYPQLLHFFRLKNIETLTIIWRGNLGYSNFNGPHDASADPNLGPLVSEAEFLMQETRRHFIELCYQPSEWYSSPDEVQILPGKATVFHDWTAEKIANSRNPNKYFQWEMDTFTFRSSRICRPLWEKNLRRNPYNHPSQLNEKELETTGPVRVWRKGFEPYTESEKELMRVQKEKNMNRFYKLKESRRVEEEGIAKWSAIAMEEKLRILQEVGANKTEGTMRAWKQERLCGKKLRVARGHPALSILKELRIFEEKRLGELGEDSSSSKAGTSSATPYGHPSLLILEELTKIDEENEKIEKEKERWIAGERSAALYRAACMRQWEVVRLEEINARQEINWYQDEQPPPPGRW